MVCAVARIEVALGRAKADLAASHEAPRFDGTETAVKLQHDLRAQAAQLYEAADHLMSAVDLLESESRNHLRLVKRA